MNELTKFLVEGILNETAEKVVALFGGGFKPPTKGHLEVVNQGIKQNPEVTEVIILVGGGKRKKYDIVTQGQAVKIWNLYKDLGLINKPVKVEPVDSPFDGYKDYLRKHPNDKVYVFIGSRSNDEDDQKDVKQRTAFVKNYSKNVIPKEIGTAGGVSGTKAREYLNTGDIRTLRTMFPENLTDEDFDKILNILNNKSTDNTRKSTLKSTEPLTPLDEAIIGNKIECDSCGWSWKIIDGGDDLFTCHKCWHDNTPTLNEADPKKGTGKKPKGSSRRLYTDEDPKDTVGVKFSTRQDIVDTLNKKSFKAKSHARQSQIINLIHQRVRAALSRTKDPAKKKKLKSGFEYIKGKKEASKKKTERLRKQKSKNENIDPKVQKKHKGKSAPFGSAYEKVKEGTKFAKGNVGSRYRAIEKRGDKYYYTQDDPLGQGIRQEFGPFKTKAAAKRKMGQFTPSQNYRDITELIDKIIDEKLCKRGYNYISKRKREGEKHNPFLTARAVKVCKGQIKGSDGKKKKDFRPKKGKKRSAQGRKPDIVKEIGIDLTNYDGQILPGDVLRAPKGFPLGGKKLESSKQLKVIKNSREGVNRYKLSLEDKDGKKYSVRNFEMDGEYKGKKLPKWGLVRKSKKNLNENATYTSYIDYKQQIRELTKHMIKKGMNILPLPRVIFKHSDTENASQFLGKTAYYSPSDMTIVLYTEGRHPKDIARSFAHEMIHHIQHLEGRLHDIQTTNTNDDDHLNDIEREAYTRGNMVFRNWTDNMDGTEVSSLSEKQKKPYKPKYGFDDKLGKDPFGLNQFARELMGETEKPTIESLEKQEEVRIFNPNCGCDKT